MAASPVITPVDRLSLTLCLAIITHATLILGVGFSGEAPDTSHADSMEIILVSQQDPMPVEDPEMLAQANLAGGGETPEQVPSTPLPPPFPDQQAELATPPTPESQPAPEQTAAQEETAKAEPKLAKVTEGASETAVKEVDEEPETEKGARTITAAELLRNSLKIASLSAQVRDKLEKSASRPRRTFISANTREYKYAAYMEAWRAKVERVGNLNYPEEARRLKLSGSLILDVALKDDGSIDQITIRRSSGKKVLDDAAVRIVELASPYAPLPDNIRAGTDILHITRTWQFIDNSGFR
jgi:protein TonB